MNGRVIYRLPQAILQEVPRILRARGLPLTALLLGWMSLLFFWHRFDFAATAWAHGHAEPFWLSFARQTSSWGELQRAPLLALIWIGLAGLKLKKPELSWAALAGALAGIIGGIWVNILKWIIGRPRPSTGLADGIYWFHSGWSHASFPSGHATHCCAIAAAVGVLAPRSGLALYAGALAVLWSRWYLERHYVSDLWGGAGFGLAIGLMIGWAAQALIQSRRSLAAIAAGPESLSC